MGTAESPTVESIREGYRAGIKFFLSASNYGRGNNRHPCLFIPGASMPRLNGSPACLL